MKIFTVDTFTNTPFTGNPASVCISGVSLDDETCQNIASEMNHSETAFVTPDGDGYSLRWFTPVTEVDLCGHATLAAAHILFEENIARSSDISFDTLSGVLTASRNGNKIQLDFPLETAEQCPLPEGLEHALGTKAMFSGKNRLDYLIEVGNEDVLADLTPDFRALSALGSRGVIATSRSERNGIDFVSRCFYPALGIDEDPVTGSAHCALGPYWGKILNKTELKAFQISRRQGILDLALREKRILISGNAVTTLRGNIAI